MNEIVAASECSLKRCSCKGGLSSWSPLRSLFKCTRYLFLFPAALHSEGRHCNSDCLWCSVWRDKWSRKDINGA